ncbi:MAG: hypothetical protein Q7T20_00675 [Saprospiraceae bacterium]|nr:hypothetical protein [Saprospiraceae bacterium]
MYASPLLRTLQLLSQEELDALHLFAASPIFNDTRPDETLALFEFLKKFYPNFESPELHRDAAGKRFFPKAANSVGALQRTMAQLMSIVRNFVTFRYAVLRDAEEPNGSALLHEVQQKLSLMRFYSERLQQPNLPPAPFMQVEEQGRKSRKAENFFENLNNQARKELDNRADFSDFDEHEFADYHLFRFKVEQEKAFFEEHNSERDGDKNLLAATEQLDTFYLLSKLDQMCRLVHYQRMWRLFEEDSPELIRFQVNRDTTVQIAQTLRVNGFLQQPAVALYCTLLDYQTQSDPAEAERLSETFEQLLEENPQALPARRVQAMRVMVRGFWPARYRETKDPRFLEKIFSMQQHQLQQLKPEENLPSTHFQNIHFTALKLGKIEWAEDFFQKYQNRITGLKDEEQKSLLLDIARAAIFFGKKDFTAASKALPHYLTYGALDDIYLYAIAATLDTRIRYEIDDLDDDYGEHMLHATATRLRRDDSLPAHRRAERLRFFPLAKDLFKLKILRSQDRRADLKPGLAKIRQRLDSETVVDWEWVEEKYASFKTENR